MRPRRTTEGKRVDLFESEAGASGASGSMPMATDIVVLMDCDNSPKYHVDAY